VPFKNTSNLKTFFTIIIFLQSIVSFGQTSSTLKIIGLTKKKTSKINSPHQIAWERQIRYLGAYREIIKVDSAKFRYSPTDRFITESDFQKFYGKENLLTTPLSLTIDTTQTISTSEFCYSNDDFKTKYFESFPVFIKNETDSLASIGYGSQLNIIVEALDTDNVWKPIEKRFIYKCGKGRHYIYLKPGEICCTLISKYNGDFLTQLRLNVNKNYSEPYYGHVFKSQFLD
jgi:hypothetical protein